ncbi:hypothetical protein CLIB1423_03S00474 [[Candida] railenensis]|uniref:Uncharacterized protein n=1 Tax=[Candida] railenensis TaxID=45579 RepID=A0A9P0QM94_9ASCO|nr:hypothetical protein CLIB1423_03S00474 [[Candida] railenensis]
MASIPILLLSLFCLVAGQIDNYYFYSVPSGDYGTTDVDHKYVQAVVEEKDTLYFFLGTKANATILTCDDGLSLCNVTFEGSNFSIVVEDGLIVGKIGHETEYTILQQDLDVYIDGYEFHCQKHIKDPIQYSSTNCAIFQGVIKEWTSTSAPFTLMAELVPSNSTEGQVVVNPKKIKLPTASTEPERRLGGSSSYHINSRLYLLAIFAALF